MKTGLNQRQKLLIVISKKDLISREEIEQVSGFNPSSINVYLSWLIKKEYIERIGHGKYKISGKGKETISSLSPSSIREITSSEKEDLPDLKNIDVLHALIKKYGGKKELFKVFDTIKEIIK